MVKAVTGISFLSFVIGIFFALFMNSCSEADLDNVKDVFNIDKHLREDVVIDRDIAPYYDFFYKVYGESPYKISATFGYKPLSKKAKNAIGVCIKYKNKRSKIIIDRDWWENQEGTQLCEPVDYIFNRPRLCSRQALIFHELGHCLFHRGHLTDTEYSTYLKRMVPVSIMYPTILRSLDYYGRQEIYNSELDSIRGDWK